MRIDPSESLGRGEGLGPADVVRGEQSHPMQVVALHHVPIHEDEAAHPGPEEGFRGVGPQGPASGHEDPGLPQPALPFLPELGEDRLPDEPRLHGWLDCFAGRRVRQLHHDPGSGAGHVGYALGSVLGRV